MISKFFPPYAWQTKLIATAALCVAFFLAGWRIHGWKTEAARAHSIPKAIKTAQSVQKKTAPIIVQKQKEIVRTEIVYRNIQRDIYEKNDQRICFSDTAAWQLYNRAITGADQYRPEHPGAAGGPEAAEGEKSANQEIIATVTDVLTNSTENYETCKKNSVKHNALIDYVEGIKDKLCYCSE
jgi:hypothetical protein